MTTIPHVRLTMSGTLGVGGGNEIWSCSTKVMLTLTGPGSTLQVPAKTDLDELAAQAAVDWVQLISFGAGVSPVGSLFSSNVAITAVKASPVTASGLDDPAITPSIVDIAAGNRGGADAASTADQMGQLPYSVALVMTFRGDLWIRGGAAYGRVYLPIPNLWHDAEAVGANEMVDGLIAPETALAFATQMSDCLSGVNRMVPLTSGKSATAANISTSDAESGARWQPITRVIVDTRPDTVRRRSNQIGGQGRQIVAVLPND